MSKAIRIHKYGGPGVLSGHFEGLYSAQMNRRRLERAGIAEARASERFLAHLPAVVATYANAVAEKNDGKTSYTFSRAQEV